MDRSFTKNSDVFIAPCVFKAVARRPNALQIATLTMLLFSLSEAKIEAKIEAKPCSDELLCRSCNFGAFAPQAQFAAAKNGVKSMGLFDIAPKSFGMNLYTLTQKGEALRLIAQGECVEAGYDITARSFSLTHACTDARTGAHVGAYARSAAQARVPVCDARDNTDLGRGDAGVKEGYGERGELSPPIGGDSEERGRVQRGREGGERDLGELLGTEGEPVEVGATCSSTYEPNNVYYCENAVELTDGIYISPPPAVSPKPEEPTHTPAGTLYFGEEFEPQRGVANTTYPSMLLPPTAINRTEPPKAKTLPDFQECFSTYVWEPHPRKRGDRSRCLMLCSEMPAESFTALCRIMGHWHEHWRQMIEDGRASFIPHPQTFLSSVKNSDLYEVLPEKENNPVAKSQPQGFAIYGQKPQPRQYNTPEFKPEDRPGRQAPATTEEIAAARTGLWETLKKAGVNKPQEK